MALGLFVDQRLTGCRGRPALLFRWLLEEFQLVNQESYIETEPLSYTYELNSIHTYERKAYDIDITII